MILKSCLATLAVVAAFGASAAAAGPAQEVNILFAAFSPSKLDVLPGETVNWTNVSERTHTVTSDTGLFDSGTLTGGTHFAYEFTAPGAYAYHCTIHPSIVGEIDVRSVILGPLPTAVVPVGTRVALSGRTADPQSIVAIQERLHGSGFRNIAAATPTPAGTWRATIHATATADVRAVSGTASSEIRRLLVSDRHVVVRATKRGIRVTVTPSAPYAPILVEESIRERFGWWPVARYRLNYISQADIRLAAPGRVRVVLVDRDGWTPLAVSNIELAPGP
jgi:plastocyanin